MAIPKQQTNEGSVAVRQKINQQSNGIITEGKYSQQQRQ
jgi:hypothetical protein